ncbi:MAG: type I-C CRISPR-associated protein Cas7/Csd2 [Clostridiaceae bacterium]|nr:type I-C CRISPR-associated protein Cas7/Csd2 [Clostridiaceae bacterium]
MSLKNKIDFAVVFSVKKANPNGDPLNGNRPRVDYDGYGEVSDVCLKRKLRNRLQSLGQEIFVQSDENRKDEYRSLKDRFDKNDEIKAAKGDRQKQAKIACKTWYDVRAFGQVFAFGKSDDENSVSIGIRGPVTIQSAVSVEPVDISSMQITKSVNLETGKDPDKKGSDTMGMKHRVDFGVYVTYGSINCQLAEITGFSESDAEILLEALKTMFMDDVSSARPDGSMEILKVVWWKHNSKSGQYSSAKVHRSLVVQKKPSSKDYEIKITKLEGLHLEEYEDL